MFKSHFGWDGFFESQCPAIPENHFIARVVNEEKNLYRIQYDMDHTLLSVIPGKMQFEARERSDYPAVGDWVIAETPPGSERAVIRFIFKRKSILQRKKVGEVSGEQILATNVDTVFITTSVNGDLNFGRLDRYLTFAWDSGSVPVILLTKADLVEDIDAVIDEVRTRFPGVDIHAVSKNYFDEAEFLKVYLEEGKTAVLVGSSGVGKSTIANFLIGEEVIFTQAIREDDEKGRHSTTSRSLYECIYGGLIIDTPGMRELQFTDHEDGLSTQFGDIEKLMTECHFSNCQHKTESNCAVLKALESGELDPDRWKSFGKIARQVNFSSARKKQWQMAEQRKTWKKRSREIRQIQKGWH